MGTWASATIIGLALLEGAAFFADVAYMQEGQPLALGVAGAAVMLILLRFPTESRLRGWLELQGQA
jgi:hypothetical protein